MSSPKIEEILNLANNRKYFNELYGIYSSGLVIPYIGAGLSVFANKYHKDKFLTWREFLNTYYQQCFGSTLDYNADLYKTANKIYDKVGEEQFYAKIKDCYGSQFREDDWNIILDSAKNEAIGLIPKLFTYTYSYYKLQLPLIRCKLYPRVVYIIFIYTTLEVIYG